MSLLCTFSNLTICISYPVAELSFYSVCIYGVLNQNIAVVIIFLIWIENYFPPCTHKKIIYSYMLYISFSFVNAITYYNIYRIEYFIILHLMRSSKPVTVNYKNVNVHVLFYKGPDTSCRIILYSREVRGLLSEKLTIWI